MQGKRVFTAMAIAVALTAATMFAGCGGSGHKAAAGVTDYEPRYASGFRILSDSTRPSGRIVCVRNPWQGAEDVEQSIFLSADGEKAPDGFAGFTVNVPAERIAVMSSSFIAMLDAIGESDRIVGVSGTRYISNTSIRERAAKGEVADIGYESNLDFERIAAQGTDIVLLYGISSEERSITGKLKQLGIPYLYIGDYVEPHPLGKAEWIVVMSELCGCRERGEEVFEGIESRYNAEKGRAAEMAARDGRRPRVMLNTPYGDAWFMPPTRSYFVQFIEDAGGEYVYPQNTSTSSVPISLEEALLLASGADVWLNVGSAGTLGELCAANPKFSDIGVVRNAHVYNNTKRMTPGGGSDFWETGAVEPDRILADMARILHTDDIPTDSLHYYKRLQ